MADIIIPVPRNPEVRTTVRQIISRLFTYIVNKISPTNIPYYNGLSVHKTSLLRNITIQTDSFGFQAEIIVRLLRAGATYKVVGTTISERKTGSSKAFTIKNILEVAKILGTKYNYNHRRIVELKPKEQFLKKIEKQNQDKIIKFYNSNYKKFDNVNELDNFIIDESGIRINRNQCIEKIRKPMLPNLTNYFDSIKANKRSSAMRDNKIAQRK
jgi:hypothetical protein